MEVVMMVNMKVMVVRMEEKCEFLVEVVVVVSMEQENEYLIMVVIGVGLIAVPYTLAQVGWLSLCFLTLMAIITWYTATLIRRCMDSNASIRTYYDMLQLTFDKKGKLILSIMMYLELFLASTGFLILEGDNLHKLFPYVRVNLGPLQIGGK
ncbi:putative Amino acid transporter [Melia azedarach]|uniref:Amino acid transporter n=1 Tax=Melia azedarach TaxID=155640 RepID=A0ACC1YIA9_MELAZ|nr:putative Amino acid transporter [Melia azedarach]